MWHILRYIFSSTSFLWGLFWDCLVLPYLGLALIGRIMISGEMDQWWAHPAHLPPLIVVHGSGSGDHQAIPAWFYLRSRFDIYTVQLNKLPFPDPTEDLTVYAGRLHAKVDRVLQKTKREKVSLLGVSMGGVVAGLVASHYPHKIEQVITLGSPWQGTPTANLVNMGTARHTQFKPHNDFVCDLTTRLANTSVPVTSIGSRADVLVPYDYAHPPPGQSTRLEHPFGHLSGVLFPSAWWALSQSV